jgi:hypothetical protein
MRCGGQRSGFPLTRYSSRPVLVIIAKELDLRGSFGFNTEFPIGIAPLRSGL